MTAGDRLDSVDGMRGIAALAVAILHFQDLFGLPYDHLKWGALPVDLFFILSGFILSRKYLPGLSSGTISAATFLIHRISRMWPLHVVALLLLLVEEYIAIRYQLTNFHVRGPADTPWAFALNVLLLQCTGIYTFPNFNLPSWSISSEMVINVAWMLLVLRGWWSRTLAVTIVAIGTLYVYSLSDTFNICAPCNGYYGINTGLVKTALGFSLGCVVFWVHDAGFRVPRPKLVAAGVSLALFAILGLYSHVVHYYADFVVVLVIFPLLTKLAIEDNNGLASVLGSLPLRWLGRISFSIYLLHVPLHNAMSYLLLVGRYPSPPAVGALFIGSLLVVSYGSYLTIERGGIWLIRRVTRSGGAGYKCPPVSCEADDAKQKRKLA